MSGAIQGLDASFKGWAAVPTSPRRHYFAGGRSLCAKEFAERLHMKDPVHDPKTDCWACAKRLRELEMMELAGKPPDSIAAKIEQVGALIDRVKTAQARLQVEETAGNMTGAIYARGNLVRQEIELGSAWQAIEDLLRYLRDRDMPLAAAKLGNG